MIKPYVNINNFIFATRDSGYKNTESALSELIDNSIEARASKIHIDIINISDRNYEIYVSDNGKGMNVEELNIALQFGGSSRFNSRKQMGRYGMGLPNSSLSQCRRIEIITLNENNECLTNYLDIDEIVEQNLTSINKPRMTTRYDFYSQSETGTIIKWKKCDRLSFVYLKSFIKQAHIHLGQIFRYSIWRGVKIYICGELIQAFDPLFMGKGINLTGGILFGEELVYKIKVPETEKQISTVQVRFVELPVKNWEKMSNLEKRIYQITKKAGASILRSEREIDYGWFFFGDKRKENYDDWWRCEIRFNPELDEVFGVTHTKQEICETELMKSILTPDLEKIARVLNNRVRNRFINAKKENPKSYAKKQLEQNDIYLPSLNGSNYNFFNKTVCNNVVKGYEYTIETAILKDNNFFTTEVDGNTIRIKINTNHIFFSKIYNLIYNKKLNPSNFTKILEVILFAAGRAEVLISKTDGKRTLKKFKEEWSNNIKTFCS